MVPRSTSTTAVADDLIRAAQLNSRVYRRRAHIAARAVDLAGADVVLDDLRQRLDTLAQVNPTATAVALAHALSTLGALS